MKRKRRLWVLVALCFALVTRPTSLAQAPAKTPARVEIHVAGPWGETRLEDVKKVCESAADQLLIYFPDRTFQPILLKRQKDFPVTLYEKGPAGEYQVRLTAGERYWAQFTYQFAHELGHILCNYERHSKRKGPHHWFEEAICETASLFVLKQMGAAWEKNPPYPNWRDYSSAFDNYANGILAKRERRLPPDTTMAQWLKRELPQLRKETKLTERSLLVAAYLLPLFEDNPKGWEALNWFNLGERDADLDFQEYLESWRQRAPEKHKRFVCQIQNLFGGACK